LEHSESMKRLLLLTSVAAMIGMAAPVYADPSGNDADFLKHLSSAGLSYKDPDKAITVAKSVCDLADKGTSGTDIVTDLQKENPDFTGDGAAKFTAIAASDYCPKYAVSASQSPKSPESQPPSEGQPPSESQPPSEGQPPKPPGA
jgi:hypothetical protein